MEIVNLLENFETKPGTKCFGATYTIASMWIASKFRPGERSEQEQKIEIYSMNLLPDRLHFWQSPSFPVPSSTPAVPSADGKKTGRRPSYRPFSKRRAMSDGNFFTVIVEIRLTVNIFRTDPRLMFFSGRHERRLRKHFSRLISSNGNQVICPRETQTDRAVKTVKLQLRINFS